MNKIQRISCGFRILFQLGFILLPIFLLLSWIIGPQIQFGTSDWGMGFTAYPQNIQIGTPISLSTRLLGFLVSLLPTLVMMYLLYCLMKLFSCYEHGQIFTLNTIYYIRNIGLTLLANVIVESIYVVLINLVLTKSQTIYLNFSSSINLSVVVLALLIILNSWIMREGYQLHQEQQLTI
ncbi:MAG TPA: DUF2975 domain-containing protein [Gammaproteobacteria bacterium]|jgi:hypothetical protein|nr:DUF2975 domain-containing protein [Gammaproteobacteria bacterium]